METEPKNPIKEWIAASGVSYAQISRETGISYPQIMRLIECDAKALCNMRISTLLALEEFMKTDLYSTIRSIGRDRSIKRSIGRINDKKNELEEIISRLESKLA